MPGIPLSPSKRGFIAGETARKSYRQIASENNCSPGTVAYAVRQRRQRGTNQTAKHPGRPFTCSPCEMAHIRRIITSHRRLSLLQLLPILQESNLAMSLSSLKRIFKRLGLMRYIARFKPFLDKRAKGLRKSYAFKHLKDGQQAWRSTIFVDEAAIKLDGHCRTFVTRAAGEGWMEDCLMPQLQSVRGSCMVWAAIWHGGRSELV
jgi:transposase